MTISEIGAKTILRKHKRVDSWFVCRYSTNLYRGCTHNCSYCDGRAEKYNVDGEFGADVGVKANAIDLLKRELDPSRRRIALKPGFIMLGGGVGDSYQPAENRYALARQALQVILDYKFPVHILTKSTLVVRDIDLLKKINTHKRAIVSFSFSSVDDEISKRFEPGVPPPSERLEAIRILKQAGLHCGAFLMPVIPFITDSHEHVDDSVKKIKEAGADFVVFAGMTLKQGRQMDYFFKILAAYNPQLENRYRKMYHGSEWGTASDEYYQQIQQRFRQSAAQHHIKQRMPVDLFNDMIDENDLVVVILEHVDYYLKKSSEKTPYSFAAYSVSQLKEPVSSFRGKFDTIKGVGKVIGRMIEEIVVTRRLGYLERLARE